MIPSVDAYHPKISCNAKLISIVYFHLHNYVVVKKKIRVQIQYFHIILTLLGFESR